MLLEGDTLGSDSFKYYWLLQDTDTGGINDYSTDG